MQTAPGETRLSGLVAILGLIALLVGLIVMILLPSIRLASWGILLVGIILLALAFIMDYRRVGRVLTGRRGRFGTATTVMVSIFIGIVLLANAISIGNYHRFDVTGVAQFTLTSQTKEVLGELEKPIEILCFFTPDNVVKDYTASLLSEYQNHTDKLSIKTIDPDLNPDQARQYNVIEYAALYGTVVFKSEYGQRSVYGPEIVERAENAFTSAILEVTGVVQKKVYFLTGHGESSASSDYSSAGDALRDNLYKIGVLDLLRTPEIPEDLSLLIIAGPRKGLTSDEVNIITRYLEDNGRALILLNPDAPKEIRQLLSLWGIDIEDGTVIDQASYAAPNLGSPSVPRTRNLFQLAVTYFPEATAIIAQEEEEGEFEKLALLWTSQDSWLERNFDPNEEPEFNEGTDLKGPLALAVLITNLPLEETEEQPAQEEAGIRLIVFGDSDFASNQHFYNGNNGELFLNTVNLLTAGTELISIERKVLPFRRLVIGPEATRFIQYSSIGLIPVIVLLIGAVIWWRRR